MRNINNPLIEIDGKNSKKIKNRGKSFGYQILGFGSGAAAGEAFVTATGGNAILTVGDYKTHVFTGPGTFCVSCAGTSGNDVADYVVIAGGGGGGNFGGGGGGAGGFRMSNGLCLPSPTTSPLASGSTLPISAQGYPITVGGGGTAGTGPCEAGRHAPLTDARSGSQGSNAVFSSITSTGGGGGAGILTDPPDVGWAPSPMSSGGSGGGSKGSHEEGGSRNDPGQGMPAGAGNTPPVSPSQGNPGGKGFDAGIASTNGGGGGGAGAAGQTTCTIRTGGNGGAGSYLADPFMGPTAPSYGTPGPVGSTRYFSGGAGGGTDGGGSCGTAGSPGVGGGGSGGRHPCHACRTAGTANTGGGGGGGGKSPSPSSGAAGGSGIVMIRYKYQ